MASYSFNESRFRRVVDEFIEITEDVKFVRKEINEIFESRTKEMNQLDEIIGICKREANRLKEADDEGWYSWLYIMYKVEKIKDGLK